MSRDIRIDDGPRDMWNRRAPSPGTLHGELRKSERVLLANLETVDVQPQTVTLTVSTALWENWQTDWKAHVGEASHPAPEAFEPVEGTWCPECGPNVKVDEEGLCVSCGATAIGNGANAALKLLADPPAPAPATWEANEEHEAALGDAMVNHATREAMARELMEWKFGGDPNPDDVRKESVTTETDRIIKLIDKGDGVGLVRKVIAFFAYWGDTDSEDIAGELLADEVDKDCGTPLYVAALREIRSALARTPPHSKPTDIAGDHTGMHWDGLAGTWQQDRTPPQKPQGDAPTVDEEVIDILDDVERICDAEPEISEALGDIEARIRRARHAARTPPQQGDTP